MPAFRNILIACLAILLCSCMATPELRLKSADMSMELKQSAPMVTSVAISPDMRFALSGSMNETATLWDLTAAAAARTFSAPSGYMGDGLAVAFSPDGLYGLTGGKGLKIWELSTGRGVRTIGYGRTAAIAVSPDGQSILTGEMRPPDARVMLWDMRGGEIRELKGPRLGFGAGTVTFSPD